MITSKRINLVKEGYLDVKVPPGNRERKLWKAWQKRWLVSRSVEEPCGLELQIYGCQKTTNTQPLMTVFISPESGKLYRSRSRTHSCAFSITNTAAVLLHLAGESELVSQSWMAAIRDALWPPSPLVQLEAAFQDVHRVSLIDDENTCRSDLFAAYGHLYMAGDVILLMSTHSGTLIKQWHLSEVRNVELIRLDEGKTSGVFSITLQNGSLQHNGKLNFYSQTADSIVKNMAAALKTKQERKPSNSSTSKYDSGIEELSEILSVQSEESDHLNSSDSGGWSSLGLSEGLRNLAKMSGDFLNCSVNSVFLHQDFSGGSRTSSDASSDYSPPVSPMDPTSQCHDGIMSPERVRKDLLDHYYYGANTKIRRNSLGDTYSDYALVMEHRSSTCSGIYADITSLPPSQRPSLAETLYEDIEDDDEVFNNLMEDIAEDEYLPPLPPPRNTNNTDIDDHSGERFTNKAKRPSSLGLENLSSSISETLSQIQSQSQPNYKMAKKNFPVGLFKPIKGVKRMLSIKKITKSPLASPTNENSKNTILSNQNLPPEKTETANIGHHHHSESLLIMHDTDLSEAGCDGKSGGRLTLESVKNSPVHISDGNFVPFPELLPVDCKNKLDENQNEERRQTDVLSPETSSVVLREGQGKKQTRSFDSLLVESLKSKYSCHQQFLEFLRDNKNGEVCHDTVPHICEQKCLLRSISLERLPCKSSHCRMHSTTNDDKFLSSLIGNLGNENLHAAVADLKAMTLDTSVLKQILSRRRSSDYCVMGPVVSTNDEKYEMCVTVYDKEQPARKESVNQEWSNSLQMQITEHESLYMDMTRTAK